MAVGELPEFDYFWNVIFYIFISILIYFFIKIINLIEIYKKIDLTMNDNINGL